MSKIDEYNKAEELRQATEKLQVETRVKTGRGGNATRR